MQRLLSFASLMLIVAVGWFVVQGAPPKPDGGESPPGQSGFGSYAPDPVAAPLQGASTAGYGTTGAGYSTTSPSYGNSASSYGTASDIFGGSPLRAQPVNAAGANTSPAASGWGSPPASQPQPIRIASYNIQVFGDSKASKPYIMATLAAIVRNFDIVAIQEIRSQDPYLMDRFLESYVNPGTAERPPRQYRYIIGPRLGRTSSKEQYAYIYDTATIDVNRQSIYTVNDPDDLLHREPLVAMFRARGVPSDLAFTFVLANLHTDPDTNTAQEIDALAQVYHVVRQAAGGEDDVILLGDFNRDDQRLGRLGQIPGMLPVLRNVATMTNLKNMNDNILLHGPSTAEFSGRAGVYDVMRLHNLSSDQAMQVSDHLPVWAEFSPYESAGPGRVATLPQFGGR